MPSEDRLTALLEQTEKRVTGIDFIQVDDPSDQTLLRVYFLIDPDDLIDPIVTTANLPKDISPATVTIVSVSGGERLAEVPVKKATYRQVSLNGVTRTVLEVRTAEPGDFSIYRLTIIDEPKGRIDRFFNNVEFSFKQGCPSVLDCRPPEPECPPEELVDFPVDYLARDFISIRNALLDFASQRYPDWSEKVEADAGVMLAEVMAALGDEFSYIQDRYAREAHLETVTQRRTLRHHTRLVDYHIHDGLTALTYLDLKVVSGGTYVDAGSRVWAPEQGEPAIPFELGEGLADTVADGGAPKKFWVHSEWNLMPVHLPDADKPCLPVGATELFIRGTFPAAGQLPTGEDPAKFWIGKWLILKTEPEDPSVPVRRHLVRLIEIEHLTDPLSLDGGNPVAITRIRWEDGQALPFEMCLGEMGVGGNLIPATAGETVTEFFSIRTNNDVPASAANAVEPAVERQGPLDEFACQRNVTFFYSLKKTETRGLGRLGELHEARPEIELQEVNAADLKPLARPQYWQWHRTLLQARGFEDKYTLEDGTWRRVIGFRRIGEMIEHADYASGSGFSIRFGDGEFGRIPQDETVFQVRYRTGPGTRANLPADTVVNLVNPDDGTSSNLATVLDAVTNPLPITSGVDPEIPQVIKQIAPDAFRAVTYRAVRPEDYIEIAERLPWVQRAGARFRWTGSWLNAFVTADPLGAFELSPQRRDELEDVMDCVRQAGREAFLRSPRYVNIDLEVAICVEPFAYAGQVKARVLEALTGRKGVRPTKGFFHPDNFTFGTPLRRAVLEAAIQDVAGVRGVERMRIRMRGRTDWREFHELTLTVGSDQVIRLQNDPRFPERGFLRILTRLEQQQALKEDLP